MKNIFSVFASDLKGIVTHFFVLVVTIGICALPALYAWFNIYANWDPYNNTGNIRLAVSIEDSGWTDSDGNYYNLGDEVRKDLEESESIDWVFVDSAEEAMEGVRSGQYYAAISLDKDFSENMLADFTEKKSLPEMKYYVNGKKNAVATKVTDTAVGSVQNSINEQYISTTAERLFGDIKENVNEAEKQSEIRNFTDKLGRVKDNLSEYSALIGTLMEGNEKLSGVLEKTAGKLNDATALFEEGSGKLSGAAANVSGAKDSFNEFSSNVAAVLEGVRANIGEVASGISSAQLKEDAGAVKDQINDMFPEIAEIKEKLGILLDVVMSLDAEEVPWEPAANEIRNLQNIITLLEENATAAAFIAAGEELVDSLGASLQSIADGIGQTETMFVNNLVPSVNQVIDSLGASLNSLSGVLDNLGSTAATLSGAVLKMRETGDMMNSGLPQIQETLAALSGTITDLIDKINEAADSEQMQLALAFLSGDASAIGNFFAEPVEIEDHYVFDIENYGSSVTPFYTALAIWVGATILAAIMKVHPDEKKFPGIKRRELFLGRYLLFLLLSELQTAVIVIGEFSIFKIQCLHPELYVLAAAIGSLTLSLIVYTLVVSFGDIGKAVAIIMLVIQIAGSGGTYPIEILPSFFRNVYLLFPFPYIINAMRECIGGMYGSTYLNCLLTLGIFCAGALVLGLLIRLPFIPIRKFMEERAEETRFM